MQIVQINQGSAKWLALRKTKITATDSSVIMGENPWKTPLQLYNEKLSDEPPSPPNAAMQRGIDLEPVARSLFIVKTGIVVKPAVVVEDWAMASLDGLSEDRASAVEIKCPSEKNQGLALCGIVPDYYYAQLQHQMFILGIELIHYFSFDGFDGVVLTMRRNDEYIYKMAKKELEFYECLQNKTPPK